MRHHRKIRLATSILINFVETQDNYDLTAEEINTLFKNSVKIVIAFGKDANAALKQISNFCKKCQVNIFETKDSFNKGLEYRLIEFWPSKIERRILDAFMTNDM